MADIVVLGAGLNGLAAGMLLARDGHRVTALERDPAEPGGAALGSLPAGAAAAAAQQAG
jgi:phytoene dehydrogenase-like protein